MRCPGRYNQLIAQADVQSMEESLEKIEKRHRELTEVLSDPQVLSDRKRYRTLAKEHAELSEIVELVRRRRQLAKSIEEDEKIGKESDDPDLVQLAAAELEELEVERKKLEAKLHALLAPEEPGGDKNAIVEIRAGTGGEEAALFAADLYRMYSKFAEKEGWKVEVLNSNVTGVGGFKEIIFLVEGRGAYSRLRFESGVHRVQRVPLTEASGRIHTSAASVVVLPEAEEVEVNVNPDDLKIDVFRSSGPGGQSVNTTDSAVRITHLPSGLVVTCQDEKSQHKNKAKALKVLRARLLDQAQRKQEQEIASTRKSMVRSGDRSEKIRTYNFPQNRVTDHRIRLTLHSLEEILAGDLEQIIDSLRAKRQEENLQAETSRAR
jgi:peptide chain release factor 1